MNLKRTIKNILGVAVAGVMSCCLVMPVFADDEVENTTAFIKLTYNTEVEKKETFSFNIVQDKSGNYSDADLPVSADNITFGGKRKSETKIEALKFGKLPEVGHYHYIVTENQTSNPAVTNSDRENLIMSQAEYSMDVYVSNNSITNPNDLMIDQIIVNMVHNNIGNPETGKVDISSSDSNGFKFTNTYVQEAGIGTDPSNPDQTYNDNGSLKISKSIINANGGTTVGNNKTFSFVANFEFPTGTSENILGGIYTNNQHIYLNNSNAYSFQLTNNESIKFTGLPVGTTVTITEEASPNYKGSASYIVNGADPLKISASKYEEDLTLKKLQLGQKQNTVDVTNTYNNVPLTGIIMNVLPYALMLVIGGVSLVVYENNKRKNYNK